ncbi:MULTISPECIES: hypothetical protein [Streptomyces]|uniref:hypothetical protein n=1 Tax=Streptomyces TaxID=1883 RepID=UPI001F3E5B14|nr:MULTISPECIES: hypothetical protein [Streptomyces]
MAFARLGAEQDGPFVRAARGDGRAEVAAGSGHEENGVAGGGGVVALVHAEGPFVGEAGFVDEIGRAGAMRDIV